MSEISYQALRLAAENATPGEWCTDDYHGVIADAGLNANYYIASCSGPDNRANKRFIAAANPATVLALLDELEKMQAQSSKWCEAFHKAVSVGARYEERIAELELKLESADKLQDSAFRHGLQHGFSLGQTDDQAGFEECLSAYGTRGKDNG
ncbi:TPA: ead/Ea22-like family protein [Escherichia coli]|uniref:ead/Ea22-like family protein n=1 Tax=Escherichia coli TaxID=562 RepID=UPI000D6A6928|nr:ead/Ea22-like family protein [Escherichia coli]EEY9907333.1 ead/Ea22-like family protein [Escherichia coli]EFN5792592.1 ead/Ea22-like family protein [Escherichia coli]EJI3743057.1 ead/Ea22-like family protein [Escherichia coli]ELM8130543.1 ead/Ea22-like family protein [Escherichia coli]ELM8226809.1 ead/Ea22-like family protein [Escherichia coli]